MFAFGFVGLLYTMAVWWRDIVKEATYEGHHTVTVQTGLRWGMILFVFLRLCSSLPSSGHSSTQALPPVLISVGFGLQKELKF